MQRILLFTFLATVSAEVFYPGPCPPVHPQENFDFSRYAGTWYEIARYPNAGEEGSRGKCTTAEYFVSGRTGKVRNTHVIDGIKSYINGDLTEIDPSTVMLTYTFRGRSKNSYLTILKTDYVNYSIGYSCKYLPETNTHQVFSWIKSRSPVIGPSFAAIVNHYVQNSPLLEGDKYISNDHSPATCANAYVYEITDFLDEFNEHQHVL